jgi:hypothetical protein
MNKTSLFAVLIYYGYPQREASVLEPVGSRHAWDTLSINTRYFAPKQRDIPANISTYGKIQ